MAKKYTERTWKARPRTYGGKKYRVVFEGRVKDFTKAEIDRKADYWRARGHSVRINKQKTYRGMEWVIRIH